MSDERTALLGMMWVAVALQVALPAYFLWELVRARRRSRIELLLVLAVAAGYLAYAYFAQIWAVSTVYLRGAWPVLLLVAAVYALSGWRALEVWPRRRGGWFYLRNVLDGLVALFLVLLTLGALAGRRAPEGGIELAFPLEAGYVWNGGKGPFLNAHYPAAAQRHALDLVALDAYGRRARGVYPEDLAAYRVYRATVRSPCDCRVVRAVDGLPDQPPGIMDRKRLAGNHLVLALRQGGEDYLVLLAHLSPGSLRVGEGERVRRGEPLARVGNTGNTSEPHLHLHAVRGRDPREIFRAPAVPVFFQGRYLVRGDLVVASGSGEASRRAREDRASR